MKFSIDYPVHSEEEDGRWQGQWVGSQPVAEYARRVEAAGFDGLGFTDHPAPSGKWLDHGGHDSYEPFSALGFCAGVTSRITLMTNLLVVPYRNPLLQAAAMATVDALSDGRTIFVLGTGYLRSEFSALGVDFAERNALFDEAVEVIRGFSSGEDYSFKGLHFEARGARISPPPEQRPHPPLWLGGNSERVMDRLARWGQGWSVLMGPPTLIATTRTKPISTIEDLTEAISALKPRLEAQGRSIEDISIQAGGGILNLNSGASAEERLDRIGRLTEIGVSWINVQAGTADSGTTLEQVQEFGETVISKAR